MTDKAPFRDDIKRIVVKIGSNTLCDPTGAPDLSFLRAVAADLHRLRSQGKQVLIISSGAIGCGQHVLGLRDRPQDLAMRQACAAMGQHRLMSAWQDALLHHHIHVGQVLLTHHTFDKRHSYLNLRNCLEKLLELGALPILNENDTVSVAEIDATFGDNDNLGALVAAKVEADLYVMLSDVPGLFDKPPHLKSAKPVKVVEAVTDKVLAMAGDRSGKGATGGMQSKLRSAKSLTEAGVPVVIAYGREEGVLSSIMDADIEPDDRPGTWFESVGHHDGKERWLRAAHHQGSIDIDAGALQALHDGFHLLPAGVINVDGTFPVESVIEIRHDGKPVARAVSHLSSRDLATCQGMQSDEAKAALGVDVPVNITRKGRLTLLD